jgi:hypothetical protein
LNRREKNGSSDATIDRAWNRGTVFEISRQL